jgi:hypothetical protein
LEHRKQKHRFVHGAGVPFDNAADPSLTTGPSSLAGFFAFGWLRPSPFRSHTFPVGPATRAPRNAGSKRFCVSANENVSLFFSQVGPDDPYADKFIVHKCRPQNEGCPSWTISAILPRFCWELYNGHSYPLDGSNGGSNTLFVIARVVICAGDESRGGAWTSPGCSFSSWDCSPNW